MIDWFADFAASSAAALYATMLGLVPLAIVFALLALIMRRGKLWSDLKRIGPETHINFAVMVFNVIFVVPAITAASTGISAFIDENNLAFPGTSFWSGMPAVVVIVVSVVVGDFTGYWRHRLEHTKLLWPSHAVHHSDTEMTWFTIERFHPVNRLTTFFIDNLVLFALGMPAYAVIANSLVRHYYGAFIHADLPWTYGRLGRIFVSPAMHRWHHAADRKAFNTNYATVFALFDEWFGTFRVPGPCTVRLGVTADMGKGLTGQLFYAFRLDAYRGLFGPKSKPKPKASFRVSRSGKKATRGKGAVVSRGKSRPRRKRAAAR